ncbi:gustatory receptor for sugar taste 43a-like [Microplitis mediator]|uniref:gustatory receptor for sugar taste 43a-like n=1 Tax=Microplitis mediator TaxID=375433 RepID=UPI002554B6F3|nr:gustatory receptor for sugar taste 43a-like [Microplitis mediator]
MWKPKNLLEALLPIYILHIIFCHGVIQYPAISKSKINYYSLVFSIITTSASLVCYVIVCWNFFGPSWITSIQIIYFIFINILTFSMYVNIVRSWISNNETLKINLRLIKADENLGNLGVPVDTQRGLTLSIKAAVSWIIASVFIGVYGIWLYDDDMDLSNKIIVVFTRQHGYNVNFFIDLTFCLLINHMKMRFEKVNKALLDILEIHTNDNNRKKDIFTSMVVHPSNSDRNFIKILHKLRRIHLELGILCHEITNVYGIALVLTMVQSFFLLTTIPFGMYIASSNPTFTPLIRMLRILTLIGWLIIAYSQFICINHSCDKTTTEWKRTGEIICKLDIESEDEKVKREIDKFSTQILLNPLKFSPCGLFDLGYYFVRDLIGSVTAQLIILIQTYPINHSK